LFAKLSVIVQDDNVSVVFYFNSPTCLQGFSVERALVLTAAAVGGAVVACGVVENTHSVNNFGAELLFHNEIFVSKYSEGGLTPK
jgi:hypothetical protein